MPAFYREPSLRNSSEKTINPDRLSWPGGLTGPTELEWENDGKGHLSVEASGEDTGEVSYYIVCIFSECIVASLCQDSLHVLTPLLIFIPS